MKETPPINIHYHAEDVCMDVDGIIYEALKILGYQWTSSGYQFSTGRREIRFAVEDSGREDAKI